MHLKERKTKRKNSREKGKEETKNNIAIHRGNLAYAPQQTRRGQTENLKYEEKDRQDDEGGTGEIQKEVKRN